MLPELTAASADSGDIEPARKAIMEALLAAGQGAAADAIEDSNLTLNAGELTVQTQLSKIMLPVHLNPDAEKIAKAALRPLGILKMQLLSGVKAPAADRVARASRPGSAAGKAADHPLVKRGLELFEAEIQTVIDLSDNN